MCTESIAEFLFGDLILISIVESKHFTGMLNALSGNRYQCPTRRYFTDTLLPKMMTDCPEEMKKEIGNLLEIGLTTDSWTSLTTENYITYTGHYITKE